MLFVHYINQGIRAHKTLSTFLFGGFYRVLLILSVSTVIFSKSLSSLHALKKKNQKTGLAWKEESQAYHSHDVWLCLEFNPQHEGGSKV